MRILLKYPTRSRPVQFIRTLSGWLSRASDPSKLAVLVSYDDDDVSMTADVLAQAAALHPRLTAVRGHSKNKIEACNADLWEYSEPWDVVLLVSDDMFCRCDGWDTNIRHYMKSFWPHTDGALWFFDGHQSRINTLECVGRIRYETMGYLYHPSYKSFFCDNESTEVGLRDQRLVFLNKALCTHESPYWGRGVPMDSLYERNQLLWDTDEANYNERKAAGFPA